MASLPLTHTTDTSQWIALADAFSSNTETFVRSMKHAHSQILKRTNRRKWSRSSAKDNLLLAVELYMQVHPLPLLCSLVLDDEKLNDDIKEAFRTARMRRARKPSGASLFM